MQRLSPSPQHSHVILIWQVVEAPWCARAGVHTCQVDWQEPAQAHICQPSRHTPLRTAVSSGTCAVGWASSTGAPASCGLAANGPIAIAGALLPSTLSMLSVLPPRDILGAAAGAAPILVLLQLCMLPCQQDVVGLDVSVDDGLRLAVQEQQRSGHLLGYAQPLPPAQLCTACDADGAQQPILQRAAGAVLKHQDALAQAVALHCNKIIMRAG